MIDLMVSISFMNIRILEMIVMRCSIFLLYFEIYKIKYYVIYCVYVKIVNLKYKYMYSVK